MKNAHHRVDTKGRINKYALGIRANGKPTIGKTPTSSRACTRIRMMMIWRCIKTFVGGSMKLQKLKMQFYIRL